MPAQATIAALSVHKAAGGTTSLTEYEAANSCSARLSAPLAATPPATTSERTPACRTSLPERAARVLSIRAATAAA